MWYFHMAEVCCYKTVDGVMQSIQSSPATKPDGTILTMRINVSMSNIEKNSLDYRPLMNVVNQCEAISPLMSMSAKVPKYIMQSANKWADVEPPVISNNQRRLMYSHDCQRENLPLRHASLKVLKMNSSLYPRQCAEVDGERLVERWALRNSTTVNMSCT